METGDILRLLLILVGGILLLSIIVSLAKRHMTDIFCLAWGLFAIILIIAGIALHPTEVFRYVSLTAVLLICGAGGCVILGAYFLSVQVSMLERKNQELAMQVSMLNQENERVLYELSLLTGKSKTEL